MSWTGNRRAWMWVAIAAVAFTSVARAEAGLQSAKAYAHPMLEFLARSQGQNPVTHSVFLRFAHRGSRRQAISMSRNASAGALLAMLPVLYIGLVSPVAPVFAASIRRLGRAPAAPLISALFQRPPPRLA